MRTRYLLRTLLAICVGMNLLMAGTAGLVDRDRDGRRPGAFARPYRNVIIMVPDGTAQSVATLARWWKDEPLVLGDMFSGAVKTYMSSSVITG